MRRNVKSGNHGRRRFGKKEECTPRTLELVANALVNCFDIRTKHAFSLHSPFLPLPARGAGQSSVQKKEAEAASTSVKANIVGKVHWGDFKQTYERDQNKDALGTGMTGTVHEWTHKRTGQCVAIKCVKKKGLKDDAINSMKQEIQLLSQLDHPNIVKILDAFEDDTTIALVMEICHGSELFDQLMLIEQQNAQEVCVSYLVLCVE